MSDKEIDSSTDKIKRVDPAGAQHLYDAMGSEVVLNNQVAVLDLDQPAPADFESDDERDTFSPLWDATKRNAKMCADVTGLSDPKRMVPIISWLPQYNMDKFTGDLIAGITVGLMVIPQGMAYANLAGLPPVYGLYSAFMGVFIYAIFGTAKDVSVGPTALMSLIVSEAFTELEHPPVGVENECSDIQTYEYCCKDGDDWACTPVHLAVAATLISGLYQIAMGFLNFGAIVDFIGFPVFNGFTTAAAVTIATSQLRHIFGLSNIDSHWIFTVRDIFKQLHKTRWQDFVMGAICMILTWILEKVKAEYTDRRKFSHGEYAAWLCGTARNAIVVVLALIVTRIIAATDAGDEVFIILGDVPAGVPSPEDPLEGLTSNEFNEVLTASIAISLLGYLESIAIGKSFAQKNGYELDPTQEMRAIGYSSVVSSFFLSYPITGSFSRTAVNSASSVATPLGGIFTGLCVIISLEVVTPAFYFIPKASLAAIIIMSVIHMIDFKQIRRIWKVKPQDMIVWCTSFLACLLWSLEFGLLLAVVVSACLSLYNQATQTLSRLHRDDEIGIWVADSKYNTEGLDSVWVPTFIEDADANRPLVVKIDGDITFTMANKFKDRMTALAREYQSEKEVRAIVIDMSGVARVDYSGVLAIEAVLTQLKPGCQKRVAVGGEMQTANGKSIELKKGDVYVRNVKGIRVHIAHANPTVVSVLQKSKLLYGNLTLGQWKLTLHATIDMAIESLPEDALDVEDRWPFEWMIPSKLAKFYETDAIEVGRAENPPRNWQCRAGKKGRKIWVRAVDKLKLSIV
eukprot:m.85960 g.85960  ORF g.85960 m.85960 type:complete len:798 (+) comp9649_c1_seq2:837-3230(+)